VAISGREANNLRSMLASVAAFLTLASSLLAPGAGDRIEATQMSVRSEAVGADLGVSVLAPSRPADPRGKRPLLVFLHGRGGSDGTFVRNPAVLSALSKLGSRAPIVAFPDGGDHSYWHDRAEGAWGRYVMREVIPTVSRRFGVDPHRIAIGGISMGGFGAYDLALLHPRRFCAVGGHSPALWFTSGETAPGAFDGAGDFHRNDVVGTVRREADAFAGLRVWNDYGDADPFRAYDEGFVAALRADGATLSAHSWPGGHDNAYWNAHWPAYLHFYANALAHCD
jgi:S-formylglutathione hydrolase FrmB